MDKEKFKEKYITFEDLQIFTICKKTLPCKHSVILPSGEHKMMRGNEIYNIIPKEHPMYNHFQEYEDWAEKAAAQKKAWEEADKLYQIKKAQWDEERRLEEEASNYNKPLLGQSAFRVMKK